MTSAEAAFIKAFSRDDLPLGDKRILVNYAMQSMDFARANAHVPSRPLVWSFRWNPK